MANEGLDATHDALVDLAAEGMSMGIDVWHQDDPRRKGFYASGTFKGLYEAKAAGLSDAEIASSVAKTGGQIAVQGVTNMYNSGSDFSKALLSGNPNAAGDAALAIFAATFAMALDLATGGLSKGKALKITALDVLDVVDDPHLMRYARLAEDAFEGFPGKGPKLGKLRHKYLEVEFEDLSLGRHTEIWYLDETPGKSGLGSIRADAVIGDLLEPIELFDAKFGLARVSKRQARKVFNNVPGDFPLFEVRVRNKRGVAFTSLRRFEMVDAPNAWLQAGSTAVTGVGRTTGGQANVWSNQSVVPFVEDLSPWLGFDR